MLDWRQNNLDTFVRVKIKNERSFNLSIEDCMTALLVWKWFAKVWIEWELPLFREASDGTADYGSTIWNPPIMNTWQNIITFSEADLKYWDAIPVMPVLMMWKWPYPLADEKRAAFYRLSNVEDGLALSRPEVSTYDLKYNLIKLLIWMKNYFVQIYQAAPYPAMLNLCSPDQYL